MVSKGSDNYQYSVLMSVYHKENAEYLRTAMDSIWNQTISTDDFVLVCDGPLNTELDSVIENMQAAHPETLHVVRLEKNGGLGNALNIGIKECKHELVARMDSDDISRADRCERQLKVFQTHPDVSVCSGTILEFRYDIENIIGKRELPQIDQDIKTFSHKRNPFNHPAVMFKRSVVEASGGYDETYHLFEDYYLWIRMFQNGAVGYNTKEPLLYMRTPEDLYMRRGGTATPQICSDSTSGYAAPAGRVCQTTSPGHSLTQLFVCYRTVYEELSTRSFTSRSPHPHIFSPSVQRTLSAGM